MQIRLSPTDFRILLEVHFVFCTSVPASQTPIPRGGTSQMTKRHLPFAWCAARFASAAVLGVAIALPLYADEGLDTPGVESSVVLPPQAKGNPPSWAGKAYHQGVVAVSHPLAAEAGARVLERGGNAVDAAVAIQFVLNVVEPQFSGIGGGGFMMIHLAKTNETFAIDGREKAPATATPTMFLFTGVPSRPAVRPCVDQWHRRRRAGDAEGYRHRAQELRDDLARRRDAVGDRSRG